MDRTVLLQNKWLKLFEDKFRLKNGGESTYYHVARSDAVMAIAIEKQGEQLFTYLVEQYRHPIGRLIWQFPLGGIVAGQLPIESAK